jgi:hypothetical protein
MIAHWSSRDDINTTVSARTIDPHGTAHSPQEQHRDQILHVGRAKILPRDGHHGYRIPPKSPFPSKQLTTGVDTMPNRWFAS